MSHQPFVEDLRRELRAAAECQAREGRRRELSWRPALALAAAVLLAALVVPRLRPDQESAVPARALPVSAAFDDAPPQGPGADDVRRWVLQVAGPEYELKPLASRDPADVTAGSLRLSGTVAVFGAGARCRGQSGRYEYVFDGARARFVVLEDACEQRRKRLTQTVWRLR